MVLIFSFNHDSIAILIEIMMLESWWEFLFFASWWRQNRDSITKMDNSNRNAWTTFYRPFFRFNFLVKKNLVKLYDTFSLFHQNQIFIFYKKQEKYLNNFSQKYFFFAFKLIRNMWFYFCLFKLKHFIYLVLFYFTWKWLMIAETSLFKIKIWTTLLFSFLNIFLK